MPGGRGGLGRLDFALAPEAPDMKKRLLSSKEGARRTSLDQFRPLLNTNQISPVYDKLGLNRARPGWGTLLDIPGSDPV